MTAAIAGFDEAALAAWMDASGLGRGGIADARMLAGGTQNLLVRFARDRRDYVLRRPAPGARAEQSAAMLREARLLAALRGTGVPHPALIAACADPAVLGAPFYLMEPVDGVNPVPVLVAPHAEDPAIRHRMGLAMVEALAALAALDPVAIGLDGFGRPDGYLGRQLERMGERLDGYRQFEGWAGPTGLGHVHGVARWLAAHRPADERTGILHGDFHLANVMFAPVSGEVAALIDWELATIGDRRVDLGWLLATWPDPGVAAEDMVVPVTPSEGFATRGELVAHYRARTGDAGIDARWFAVFACWKLAILLEGTHARACAGRVPMATGAKLHARAARLIARAEGWIARAPDFAGQERIAA